MHQRIRISPWKLNLVAKQVSAQCPAHNGAAAMFIICDGREFICYECI